MPTPPYPSTSFAVDNESGQIQFGDGLRGMRPPFGATMVTKYAYGGGSAGNVGIAAIQSSPQLPAGFLVANPLPTWGGDDGQTVTDAERSIPAYLQNGGRAVSRADFQNIVEQTPGIALGRVETLPLFSPDQVNVATPGAVTVMVIPDGPGAPEPDLMFLDAVCSYLDPRRLVTTEVYVRGPQYVDLSVSIGIDVLAGRDIATVREAVRQAVRQYLSPIAGGPTGKGWPLSKTVDPTGILVQALKVDGVNNVRGVLLFDGSKATINQLPISGLQLPNLAQLMVTAGDAQDLSAVETPPARQRVSVPMIQPQC
jgi:predicted phage baseplate assembly protein